ncbi:MAG: flavin reductase [Clostridia bacterium]|nr:flavin reductase [Clostridia bacterium]
MFRSVKPEELKENPFTLIGKDWMLLTAAKPDGSFNQMTASWGGLGILWGKPVCFCFIRPQRYTHEFSEAGDRLSATFFSEEYRAALALCGRKSGREIDKVRECGLTPVRMENGTVYYEEAKLVLACRKLYAGRLEEGCFVDKAMLEHYPQQDYHTVYVYEIEEVLLAD